MISNTQEKAVALVEENRIVQIDDGVPTRRVAVVAGHHAAYTVEARREGLTCSCPATSRAGRHCSHMLAAMICWEEGRGVLA